MKCAARECASLRHRVTDENCARMVILCRKGFLSAQKPDQDIQIIVLAQNLAQSIYLCDVAGHFPGRDLFQKARLIPVMLHRFAQFVKRCGVET